jgi:hypothetical protein
VELPRTGGLTDLGPQSTFVLKQNHIQFAINQAKTKVKLDISLNCDTFAAVDTGTNPSNARDNDQSERTHVVFCLRKGIRGFK